MNPENQIVQSNFLARGEFGEEGMTVREQKIWYIVISMIKPDDPVDFEYLIPVQELYRLIGVKKGTPSRDIKKVAERITNRVVYLPKDMKNPNENVMVHMLSVCQYKDGEGVLRVIINRQIRPFLIGLGGDFTTYKLLNILPLKSEHSISLYRYFKSFSYQGKVIMTPDELRMFLFSSTEVSKVYSHLKRDVITKALKEINEKTDIEVKLTEEKVGRAVAKLTFEIKEKNIQPSIVEKTINSSLFKIDSVIRDILLENFERHHRPISVDDADFLVPLVKEVWKENEITEIPKAIEMFFDTNIDIKKPAGLFSTQLNRYKKNVINGKAWDYGYTKPKKEKRKSVEELMGWDKDRDDTMTPEEEANFQEEKERLLQKIRVNK